MNYKGVSRTAPATPGLLTIFFSEPYGIRGGGAGVGAGGGGGGGPDR